MTVDITRLVQVVQDAEATHRVQNAEVDTPELFSSNLVMEAVPTADGTIQLEFTDGRQILARGEAPVPVDEEQLRVTILRTYADAELSLVRQKAKHSARDASSYVSRAAKRAREEAASLRESSDGSAAEDDERSA